MRASFSVEQNINLYDRGIQISFLQKKSGLHKTCRPEKPQLILSPLLQDQTSQSNNFRLIRM